ncbi:MAG TPA: GntR family transcriptional regulator [Rhizobiaceae bacterium]|nr:GntR family transcriptional regulator [Rhizobiaceae bacterium]
MAEKLAPVDVSTLQERVYLRLREALYQGKFSAGETLTIRGLAAALGTSAMPVREALQRLVAEKALVQTPSRSIRVASFTPELFWELIRIRLAIEGMATRRAALNSSPALVESLREINASMIAAIKTGFTEEVLDANKRFHFTIYEAAAMPQLLEIINNLWLRTGPYLGVAYRMGYSDPFLTGTRFHERVVKAIERRDGRKAASNLKVDIWATAKWFTRHRIAIFDENEEKPLEMPR